MSKIKLYGYFRSSASYRVRIALHHKNLDFENIPVHLVKDGGEQYSDAHKARNPMGQVPSFVDGEFTLNQSVAIMQYLDEKYPDTPQVFPQEIEKAATVLEICEIVNSGIQPLQNLKVLHYLKNTHGFTDEKKNEWCRHWISEGFKGLESRLAKTAGEFSFGNEITAADMCLVPQAYNALRFGVDMSDFKIISRVNEACASVAAFKKAEPSAQPDAPS